jgi:hypothetical protein
MYRGIAKVQLTEHMDHKLHALEHIMFVIKLSTQLLKYINLQTLIKLNYIIKSFYTKYINKQSVKTF